MLLMRAAIWTEMNIRTNFLISYAKQVKPLPRHNATKIFGGFVDQKPQRQISSFNFQNDALKNLFI